MDTMTAPYRAEVEDPNTGQTIQLAAGSERELDDMIDALLDPPVAP